MSEHCWRLCRSIGIDDVVGENCLPAGETLYSSVQFTVTPGHD